MRAVRVPIKLGGFATDVHTVQGLANPSEGRE
jgi:hypothetical protein